jgi:EAL domain-containing protein (putative c-di-GMP-specific phosphodiesterase class I)
MCDSTADAGIVRAVVGLADAMDLDAIAEGVEVPEQAAALLAVGCTHAQGYLFGRPAPAASFDLTPAAGREPVPAGQAE